MSTLIPSKMPPTITKVRRRTLNLTRVFGISLFYGLLLIIVLFYFQFKLKKSSVSTTTKRPLIVDLECLSKLATGQNCDFPISVAIPFGEQFENGDYMRVGYFGLDSSIHNYWLFHSTTNQTERIAIKKFKIKGASLRFPKEILAQLQVPADIGKFIQSWRNGRFIQCEPILIRPPNVERVIPLSYLDRMVEFADLIERHNATAFILSGTLLGWHRECSLLPHTLDADFGIFHEQHSDALLRSILQSPVFTIHWVLGRLRNSLELAVDVDGHRIDLFHVYQTENSSFINGMRPNKRQRLKWIYPKLSGEICTGEMHGRLFHLPCDFQKIFQADYGIEGWKKDIHTNSFGWDTSPKNQQDMEIYTEEEWPNVFLLVQNKTERFVPAIVDKWMENINKTA